MDGARRVHTFRVKSDTFCGKADAIVFGPRALVLCRRINRALVICESVPVSGNTNGGTSHFVP